MKWEETGFPTINRQVAENRTRLETGHPNFQWEYRPLPDLGKGSPWLCAWAWQLSFLFRSWMGSHWWLDLLSGVALNWCCSSHYCIYKPKLFIVAFGAANFLVSYRLGVNGALNPFAAGWNIVISQRCSEPFTLLVSRKLSVAATEVGDWEVINWHSCSVTSEWWSSLDAVETFECAEEGWQEGGELGWRWDGWQESVSPTHPGPNLVPGGSAFSIRLAANFQPIGPNFAAKRARLQAYANSKWSPTWCKRYQPNKNK